MSECADTEKIARDIALDQGNEGWWRYLHPVVKWTVKWLDERGYLLIVKGADS